MTWVHGAKNVPWPPEYPSGQSQIFGAVQVPPFSQAGANHRVGRLYMY